MKERESFASRLGFVLISAGCAIGLGNVWRFPYITGKYGGAAFVLIYLLFLLILGLPVMVMEFSVGRASQRSIALSFQALEPKGTRWHWYSWFGIAGNYLLMMFYTTVAGWLMIYCIKMARGDFAGMNAAGVGAEYKALQGQPALMTLFMVIVVALCMLVCSRGLRNGVEKVNKVMMVCLLAVMVLLAVRSVTLDGAGEGLAFYLRPNFHNLMYDEAAELHPGRGHLCRHGPGILYPVPGHRRPGYLRQLHRQGAPPYGRGGPGGRAGYLRGLYRWTHHLPSLLCLMTWPPDSGFGLIFVTLPNVFNSMSGGRLWGALFFVFMSFAALSTITAVFENIISFAMDRWGWSRRKAVWVNFAAVSVLSMPCILGFNLWSGFQPLGDGQQHHGSGGFS